MKKNNFKIAIIGSGWLGTPLYELFVKNGEDVMATKSSQLDVTKDQPPACDILIYLVPPLGQNEIETFFAKVSPAVKILFISSTSVYEKNLGRIDETSPIKTESVLGKSETWLSNHFKNLSILRLGGLYGLQRHPVKFLAGRKDVKSANEFLHLAHLDDCLSAIVSLIEKELWGEVFNIVCDLEITKKDYYCTMARKLNLEEPVYSGETIANPTRIQNTKSHKLLGLTYVNPLDYA